MTAQTQGIHHVTAIAGDPQRNVDFYLTVMGMRLVKQTVNFDSPETYHLYYADEVGTPGTILTFFPWRGAPQGRRGTGQATTTSFSIPEGSLGWWQNRLAKLGVPVAEISDRAHESGLSLHDPDGLLIELVEHTGSTGVGTPWQRGPVPAEHAIRGLHSVTLTEQDDAATASLLTDELGFQLTAEEGDRSQFSVGEGGSGATVTVVRQPGGPRGLVAAGTVHHVAWRVPDGQIQEQWRDELTDHGLSVTPILDRQYFTSIYFREPGGVLLEMATDPPGFGIDEPLLELGRKLKLPPWLEPNREAIQQLLPEIKLPEFDDENTWRAGA